MRYILILMVLSFACSKKTTSTSTFVKDSTIIKEVVRLDTIHIKGDTLVLTEFIECDSVTNKPKPFKITGKSGRVSAKVIVDNKGEIQIESVCDSLNEVIEVKDREISRLREENKHTIIKEEPSKFKVWIDYTCRILAALFILYILFNIFRTRIGV